MDNNNKKQGFYTFIIMPHDARRKPISLKITTFWAYSIASLLIFSFILVGSSMVYSTLLSRRMVDYAKTISKNKEQQEIITSFSSKTKKVESAIDELTAKDHELRTILGLKKQEDKAKNTLKKEATREPRLNDASLELELANERIAERRKSLDELKRWVAVVRSRYASTPSTWPIKGKIVSSFGYRAYPWRGFHGGIDIQARYGDPVRVTAQGMVTFTGWRNGYGKTVEISHGNGVKTLYAHCSGYAVRVGQIVKQGKVICYVGNTGWTTGPHLHYEVHRTDQAINPVAFLNLNIFSASRLWR